MVIIVDVKVLSGDRGVTVVNFGGDRIGCSFKVSGGDGCTGIEGINWWFSA